MREYYIYDTQTDKLIYKGKAWSIIDAELQAIKALNKGSGDIYALSKKYDLKTNDSNFDYSEQMALYKQIEKMN